MPSLEDPKHEKFAQEYCVDFNATQAAIRAGYSKSSARQQASVLLTKPNISARVKEIATQDVTKVEMSRERILRELSFIATVDPKDFYDENGNVREIVDMPENVRRAIGSIEVSVEKDENGETLNTETKKFKCWDKNTSLLGLAKVFKMLTDKVEHEHKVTLESFLGGTWPEDDQKGNSPKDKKK